MSGSLFVLQGSAQKKKVGTDLKESDQTIHAVAMKIWTNG